MLILPPRAGDETWLALKAMYGLRQSRKAWGDHRDAVVAKIDWFEEGTRMFFQPLSTDPNVWKIMAEGICFEDEDRGLMLVYVDDLMILGPTSTVRECLRRIASGGLPVSGRRASQSGSTPGPLLGFWHLSGTKGLCERLDAEEHGGECS